MERNGRMSRPIWRDILHSNIHWIVQNDGRQHDAINRWLMQTLMWEITFETDENIAVIDRQNSSFAKNPNIAFGRRLCDSLATPQQSL